MEATSDTTSSTLVVADILKIVDAALQQQSISTNDVNLLKEFRDVVASLQISPTPTFDMMTLEQLQSLMDFNRNLQNYKYNPASPKNPPIDNINTNINYTKLYDSKVILTPIMEDIRKLTVQREMFNQFLIEIDTISTELTLLKSKKTLQSEAEEYINGFFDTPKFIQLAEDFKKRTTVIQRMGTLATSDDN